MATPTTSSTPAVVNSNMGGYLKVSVPVVATTVPPQTTGILWPKIIRITGT